MLAALAPVLVAAARSHTITAAVRESREGDGGISCVAAALR